MAEQKPTKTIFWLAGENFGDLHASLVMRKLNIEVPYCRHIGIGGNRMRAEGLEPLFPFERFAVMGFIEVIRHLGFFHQVERAIKRVFHTEHPDLVVLVDYPGLNLRVARFADDARIPVLYFICPQFWAWKHKRVFKLKDFTRHVACILPFEKDMLDIHRINCTYVGHPIAEEVNIELDRNSFARFYGLDSGKKWIGFFPGSRNDEIERLLPIYLKTIRLMDNDDYQFLFSKARNISHTLYTTILHSAPDLHPFIIDGYSYEMMKYCEILVLKSGTTTLEAAYIGTPSVIVYKANPLSYQLGKYFVKVDKIGLPNLILDKKVLPELIQDNVKPGIIAAALNGILSNPAEMSRIKKELANIHSLLGDRVASSETVKVIRSILQI